MKTFHGNLIKFPESFRINQPIFFRHHHIGTVLPFIRNGDNILFCFIQVFSLGRCRSHRDRFYYYFKTGNVQIGSYPMLKMWYM